MLCCVLPMRLLWARRSGGRLRLTRGLKSPQEMQDLFEDIPEAISNTLVIAQRCGFMVTTRNPILPPFPTEKGEEQELLEQAEIGLRGRLETQVFTADQTDEEKQLITSKQYFRSVAFGVGCYHTHGVCGLLLDRIGLY